MRSRWLLLVGVLAVAGCQDRKTESTYDPPPQGPRPNPAPAGTPGPSVPAPAAPLQGATGGKPFVPDNVVFEGRSLSFRKGKEFFPEMEIKFDNLPAGKLEGKDWKFEGDKFENPTVVVTGKDIETKFNWPKDYTAAIRITKVTSRAVEGTIDLKANQPANTHLRGPFVAVRKKTSDEPLDPDDAPYVQGKISFVGPWKEESLAVGFVGKGADGKEHSNMIGTSVSPKGGSGTSTTFDPQLTSLTNDGKGNVGYRHTRLPPGEYLVYVKRNRVMAAWRKLTVKAGDQQALDLTIDSAKTGEVVVRLPDAEANDEFGWALSLRPTDLDVPVSSVSFAFDAAEVKKGQTTVTVKGVPAGKYRAVRGKSAADVEVTAGKSAAVTLVRDEPKKK